jgi:hypothetical protein
MEAKFGIGIRAASQQAEMLMKMWTPPVSSSCDNSTEITCGIRQEIRQDTVNTLEIQGGKSETAANAVAFAIEDECVTPMDTRFRAISVFLFQQPPPSTTKVRECEAFKSLFESHLPPIPIKDFLSGLAALHLKKNQLEPILNAFIPEAIRLSVSEMSPPATRANLVSMLNDVNGLISESPWNACTLAVCLHAFKTTCLSLFVADIAREAAPDDAYTSSSTQSQLNAARPTSAMHSGCSHRCGHEAI